MVQWLAVPDTLEESWYFACTVLRKRKPNVSNPYCPNDARDVNGLIQNLSHPSLELNSIPRESRPILQHHAPVGMLTNILVGAIFVVKILADYIPYAQAISPVSAILVSWSSSLPLGVAGTSFRICLAWLIFRQVACRYSHVFGTSSGIHLGW